MAVISREESLDESGFHWDELGAFRDRALVEEELLAGLIPDESETLFCPQCLDRSCHSVASALCRLGCPYSFMVRRRGASRIDRCRVTIGELIQLCDVGDLGRTEHAEPQAATFGAPGPYGRSPVRTTFCIMRVV